MPKAAIEYPLEVVNRNNNGGYHRKGKRAYLNAVRTIQACLLTYRKPRLYHLCFEGKTHKTQMKMLNGAVQIADRAGISLEWFACREVADRTKKAHIHAFVIIDAFGLNPYRVFNQFDDGQIAELCAGHGVNFSIFSPKDDAGIHGRTDYMTLPYQGPGNRQTARGQKRLADALLWLTYCFKARSKPTDEEADGQLFPASRPNRKRRTPDASPLADSPAPSPTNESKPDEIRTTPKSNASNEAGAEASRLDSPTGSPASQEQSDHGPEACSTLLGPDRSGGNAPGSATSRRPGPARPEAEPDHELAVEAPTESRVSQLIRCQKSTDYQHPCNTPVLPVRKLGIALSNSSTYTDTVF